jgi:hypothetical protein
VVYETAQIAELVQDYAWKWFDQLKNPDSVRPDVTRLCELNIQATGIVTYENIIEHILDRQIEDEHDGEGLESIMMTGKLNKRASHSRGNTPSSMFGAT